MFIISPIKIFAMDCISSLTDVQRFAEALQTELGGSSTTAAEGSNTPDDKKESSSEEKDDKDNETK